MENLSDFLKIIISALLMGSVVLFFSCEKKRTEGEQETNTSISADTAFQDTVESDTTSKAKQDSASWKTKMENESHNLEVMLDSLKVKARMKGKQTEKQVNQAIENLDKQRKSISTSNYSEDLKYKWEEFKINAKAVIDSLDKKL